MRLARRAPLVLLAAIIGCSSSASTPATCDSCGVGATDAASSAPRVLELVAEKKLSKLLSEDDISHWEASGVVANNGTLYVACDNMTKIASIDTSLSKGSLGPGDVVSSQYEAITASDDGRFFAMVETVSETDLRAEVVTLDATTAPVSSAFTDVTFTNFNKGFEGAAWLRVDGAEYLLALCENNDCKDDDTTPGKGRVKVLSLVNGTWTNQLSLKLPSTVEFINYSDLALRANGDGTYTVAIVSRKSSALWLGTLDTSTWAITGPGSFYTFPPGDDGAVKYCTVEGVTFLGPSVLAFVSDKGDGTAPCNDEDESIHIFRAPG